MIPTILTSMGHDIDPGDRCDAWGNALPVSAAIQDPASATDYTPSPNQGDASTFVPSGGLDTPAAAQASGLHPSVSHKKAILKKLARTVSVARGYAACVVARSDFERLCQANWESAHLEDSIKTHRALIASETDFAVIQATHEKLALLESPSAAAARDATCGALRQAIEPLCLATQALMKAAIEELDTLATQAREDEKVLHENWGMASQETAISRSIAAVRRELTETQKGVKLPEPSPFNMSQPPNPCGYDHAIEPFSVTE
jgi:hypothetical protein